MGSVYKSAASLRLFGDDLDPDEITARLGAEPTRGVRKGGIWETRTGVSTPARTGSWRLVAERQEPGDLDAQVAELLDRLTDDPVVWADLTARFRGDMFCGLFLRTNNEGLNLSSKTMRKLGERGLSLGLDIYGPDEE